MKVSAMGMVALTTLLLVTIALLVGMDFPFRWIFLLTVIGQLLVVYMVYKVLTDNYSTDKTFEDLYEDHPMPEETQRLP